MNSHDDALEVHMWSPPRSCLPLTYISQVIFEGDSGRRRKASLAPPPGTKMVRPENGRRSTACIVHSLLEKQDGVTMDDYSQSYEGLSQERRMDKDPHAHADQTQHSRLLTKKQISDMAFGIRELSKKLAQIRLKLHIKNIFILGKAHDEELIKHSREVTDWLLTKDASYRVYVEKTLEDNKIFDAAGLLEKNPSYKGRIKYWTNELCAQQPQTFDIVLAVRMSPLRSSCQTNICIARRRRHGPLLLMALPAHRPACPRILPRVPRLPHKIRLRAISTDVISRFRGRHYCQPASALRSDRHALAGPRTQGSRLGRGADW